jgi:hypothetical protein
VAVGLGMDDQHVGPGITEGFQIAGGLLDHEVHVEEKFAAAFAQAFDDGLAKGDIGHEGPVHDVQVQPRDARGLKGGELVGQTGEIGGEQGRRKDHAASCGALPVVQDRRGVLPERQDRGSPAGQNAAQLGQLVFQLQHQGRIALAGGAFRQDLVQGGAAVQDAARAFYGHALLVQQLLDAAQ